MSVSITEREQTLVTADGLWTLEDKIKRRMKKGWRLVPGSAQCVDPHNSHGWWAAMEKPDDEGHG